MLVWDAVLRVYEGGPRKQATRGGETVTLVHRGHFSLRELAQISSAVGERTIHCVDEDVHFVTERVFFRCAAFRAGAAAGKIVFPPEADDEPGDPPERLAGARSPDEVLERLGLSWADLGKRRR